MSLRHHLKALKVVFDALVQHVDPDSLDGFDPDFVEVVLPYVDRFWRWYFDMKVEGLERVPSGPALIVGNHEGGTTFPSVFGMMAQWYATRGTEEPLYGLGHDLTVLCPFVSNLLARGGDVRACHKNADALLARGHKVLVCPGSDIETFRPFRDRHKIDFGGRQGFIRLALRNGVPIVPVVFTGGHETFFVLSDGRRIARAVGLKRLARTEVMPLFIGLPWIIGFGPLPHVPIPAHCRARFLEPIDLEQYAEAAADSPDAIDEIYRFVTSRMQQALRQMTEPARLSP